MSILSRCAVLLSWILLCVVAAPVVASPTELVSVGLLGLAANGPTVSVSISADGRFVAFDSYASNLVFGDTNGVEDVFVFDRQTGTVERVSVTDVGQQPNGNCYSPSISGDSNLVAFVSSASNMVFGGSLVGIPQVYLRDRRNGTTVLVSGVGFGSAGNGFSDSPSISADGQFVAFTSFANNLVSNDGNFARDIFLSTVRTGLIERVSVDSQGNQGNGDSTSPSISGDGRWVAFASAATNLIPSDGNIFQDIFLHDRLTRETSLVSVSSLGVEADSASGDPAISKDGTAVAFASLASNLVVRDTNGVSDVFVNTPESGLTVRVSVASDGTQGNSFSTRPTISATGRQVAFQSIASNLVPGLPTGVQNVFVHDRLNLLTTQISVTPDGRPPNGSSSLPSISGDGREVAFVSAASNLVSNDGNFVLDAFVRQWITFTDVRPGDFGFREIEAVAQAGIVEGYSDGTYRPALVVTRDQMAVFISRALARGDAGVPPGPAIPTFPDVPRTYWAYRYIEFASARNVVTGLPDGTYQPTVEVDRAQMAVFIARAVAGSDAAVPPGPPTPTFPDVPTDFWAYKHVEFCRAQQIVFGYLDGLYHPEIMVARDQMAVFIQRTFDLPVNG